MACSRWLRFEITYDAGTATTTATDFANPGATKVRRVEQGEVKIDVGGITAPPGSAGSFRLGFENH